MPAAFDPNRTCRRMAPGTTTSARNRTGIPPQQRYQNVLYMPASIARDPAIETRYVGGLFDQDKRSIREGFLWRGKERMSRAPRERPQATIAQKALYLGWMFPAYGHVLLESLSRCWAVPQSSARLFVFHAPTVQAPPPFALEFLSAFDIRPDQIVIPTAPTLFTDIDIPAPGLELHGRAFFGNAMRHVYEKISGFADRPQDRPVYISRSRLPGHRRAIVGEAVLEKALAQQGFEVAHPELMPLSDQIALFRNRKIFVGAMGSAMHNIVFNRRGAQTLYLTGHAPNSNYLLCDTIANAKGTYISCCDRGGLPDLGRPTPLRLNLDKAMTALVQAGVADYADLRHHQPDVDAEQRRLWALVRLEQGHKRREGMQALEDVKALYAGPITPEMDNLMKQCRDAHVRRNRGRAA